MKILFCGFIFMSAFGGMTTPNGTIEKLSASVSDIVNHHKGIFAVAFKDLQTGKTFFMNEKEVFHAASTMKTSVMLEIFNQVSKGDFSLDDSLKIVNKFTSIIDGSDYSLDVSDDSEDQLYSKIGAYASIRYLLTEMIISSSNFATNLLIEKIKADSVMRTLHTLGLDDIHVLRGVEDLKAFDAGKNNTTDALDLMKLFELIADKKAIDKKSSEEMIDILLKQRFHEMIPTQLPPDVKVAHKTGSITNLQHDAGIIYLPDGRTYVLVVLSKNLESNADGVKAIADISKAVYDYMVN